MYVFASENRLRSMGDLSYSLPDADAKINLFKIAKNNAYLKKNDSTNWMIYNTETRNSWGKLKRNWDAYQNQFSYLSFSGQKHIDDDKIFYGDIRYNWDYRGDVDYAIEKNPYGFDPFVLADYTTGSILYRGPEVRIAFNQVISKFFYWGIGLNYYINRGLKNKSSEAEIIDRSIKACLDIVYNFNESINFGLSFSPYQIQDITKLVEQKDGLQPTVRRYRGEFEYRERTTTNDRAADYDGYEIRPQFMYHTNKVSHISYFKYFYQWHQIYDNPSTRNYDGFFQAQHFGFYSITRYKLSDNDKLHIFLEYQYTKFDDWGKGPTLDLLISRDFYDAHLINLGGSKFIRSISSTVALEFLYNFERPQQIDYLANQNRQGDIITWIAKIGMENQINADIFLRYGFNFENYSEDKVWNYFHDYRGYLFTLGFGWHFLEFELDFLARYRFKEQTQNLKNGRTGLNFSLQLKQLLN